MNYFIELELPKELWFRIMKTLLVSFANSGLVAAAVTVVSMFTALYTIAPDYTPFIIFGTFWTLFFLIDRKNWYAF